MRFIIEITSVWLFMGFAAYDASLHLAPQWYCFRWSSGEVTARSNAVFKGAMLVLWWPIGLVCLGVQLMLGIAKRAMP